MNFADIFQTSFLQGYVSDNLTSKSILAVALITTFLSGYIFVTYHLVNKKSFYNKSFHTSLFMLGIITSGIILTIQSNIVVSLGMVGALSIVRFRTAIKEPMDLVFLFWSISVGIMCGASCFGIAVIYSMIITLGIIVSEWLPTAKASRILLVNSENHSNEKQILKVVESSCSLYKVKARNLTKNHLDMAIEVKTKDESLLVNSLIELEHVVSASLVSHDGEVTF